MKRVIGFALICFALGMILMCFLPECAGVCVIIICLLLGYKLFCC